MRKGRRQQPRREKHGRVKRERKAKKMYSKRLGSILAGDLLRLGVIADWLLDEQMISSPQDRLTAMDCWT